MGLSLDTWVSLIALCGFGVTLFAAVRSGNSRLHDEMTAMRAELKGDMSRLDGTVAELRTELKADIADVRTELKADLHHLDDRVYALAAGLRPLVEQAKAPGPVT